MESETALQRLVRLCSTEEKLEEPLAVMLIEDFLNDESKRIQASDPYDFVTAREMTWLLKPTRYGGHRNVKDSL